MIRTDGKPTIANSYTSLDQMPLELLSQREREERAAKILAATTDAAWDAFEADPGKTKEAS